LAAIVMLLLWPVGEDATVASAGQLGREHELGEAADHGDVRLGDVDLAALEHKRVLMARGEAHVAAADQHPETLEAGMAVHVIERHPGEVVLLEWRHQRRAVLGRRPGSRRVYHEPHVRAHVLSCGADQTGRMLEVVAPERVGHDRMPVLPGDAAKHDLGQARCSRFALTSRRRTS
jgi:hypothetical protein